jgi:hypothetical protein
LQSLDFGDSFKAEPLQIRREGADPRPLVAVQLSQRFRILPGFLIVLYNALDGLIEGDERRYVAGNNLR